VKTSLKTPKYQNLTKKSRCAIITYSEKRSADMMDQFVVRYIPGGMTLYHSGWWLCQLQRFGDGQTHEALIRMLVKSNYQ
jgi:hypothetical protein